MKTLTFIGSDKNAGKTTAFNFVYKKLQNAHCQSARICMTSTGISGEAEDKFTGRNKPFVDIFKNTYFITSSQDQIVEAIKR